MLGVKKDAIPGRINETWARIDKPGIYFGQCSELCGTNHGYMPIEIHAVSKEDFKVWADEAQKKFPKVKGAELETDSGKKLAAK
jgi:cytochrome c oxidase subunit 2